MLLAAVLCAGMLHGQVQYKQLVYVSQSGDWTTLYESRRALFGASGEAREVYLRACFGQGRLDEIVAETAHLDPMGTQELLCRSQALWGLGRQDEACRLLLSQLEGQLYNTALLTETKNFFTDWQAGPEYRAAYNRLADLANSSRTALGNLKGDQMDIALME